MSPEHCQWCFDNVEQLQVFESQPHEIYTAPKPCLYFVRSTELTPSMFPRWGARTQLCTPPTPATSLLCVVCVCFHCFTAYTDIPASVAAQRCSFYLFSGAVSQFFCTCVCACVCGVPSGSFATRHRYRWRVNCVLDRVSGLTKSIVWKAGGYYTIFPKGAATHVFAYLTAGAVTNLCPYPEPSCLLLEGG